MIKIKILLLSILGAVLLTGCTTTSGCDPRVKRNTLENLGCVFGDGGYEEEVDAREKKLEEAKAINGSLSLVLSLLEEERKSSSRGRATLQSSYHKLDKTVSNLIAQVKARESTNKNLTDQVSKLQSKLDSVNKNQASTSNKRKELSLMSLQKEIENIQKELQYE